MRQKKNKSIKERHLETSTQINLKYTTDKPVDQLHPAFCFKHLQRTYGFPQDRRQRNAIINTIEKLSQQPWGNLKRSGSRQIGFHTIRGLEKKSPIILAKDAKIISFDCGNGRMIGYRDAKIFYVFWLDWPPFGVYRHN